MFDFNQKPDLNITPLVDIMLVLLAILMVTAPVIEFEEPINLPTGSKSQQSQDVAKIDIIITKDRIVTLNKNKVEISNFADNFLLFSKGKDQNTPIHIRADKSLKYDDIVYVLKSVKEAGFFKVALVTDG
ncbi:MULTISPECIES: biopolymer transporter ExbD [Aliarcobacter]|uniref:Biopolymer transporter ExbD n=7 Tax=Arcobacteraceae TaxID=2808963 RepID=A0AAU0P393_9BACT|nr:biopolymer transporter ExbD [Aliarcobacter cryaerophilus]MBK6303966.1 biopolymer transporter ExbD [Arcobacter sp.]NCB10061.1 biopolymer transporter ExbD [Erysipelotrichia bacterium]OQA76070.1 MAG: Biopolymer transport protein ExbD [Candidatus Dependentiae bacterium ADurb.Bin246]WNL12043.1 biopolymer transporter ExbD [Arcobacter sp. AZ-2023]WPD03493.1 biopolymer transporter ExbD [Arcobacter sp. DSM 115972]WPD05534.1 biopolymer transporter ExbD [Arcobacter sp. DSM 115956]WPD07626.1 biopolym